MKLVERAVFLLVPVLTFVVSSANADLGPGPRVNVECSDDCSVKSEGCLYVDPVAGQEYPPNPIPAGSYPRPRSRSELRRDGYVQQCKGFRVVALGGRFCTKQGESEVWCAKGGKTKVDASVPLPTDASNPTPHAVLLPDATLPVAPSTSSKPPPIQERKAEQGNEKGGCAAGPSLPRSGTPMWGTALMFGVLLRRRLRRN